MLIAKNKLKLIKSLNDFIKLNVFFNFLNKWASLVLRFVITYLCVTQHALCSLVTVPQALMTIFSGSIQLRSRSSIHSSVTSKYSSIKGLKKLCGCLLTMLHSESRQSFIAPEIRGSFFWPYQCQTLCAAMAAIWTEIGPPYGEQQGYSVKIPPIAVTSSSLCTLTVSFSSFTGTIHSLCTCIQLIITQIIWINKTDS